MAVDEEKLINDIRYNSPWIYSTVDAIGPRITNTYPRFIEKRIFGNLVDEEHDPKIFIFTGPRNVGKTTLSDRLIMGLFNKKVPKERVLYFSFDTKRYPLDIVLDTYFSRVLGEPVSELKQSTFIFLDEIQSLDDWAQIIKKYYDLSANKLVFVITGSSSSKIVPQANRYLTGRFTIKPVYPVKFSEYLIVKTKNAELESIITKFISDFESGRYSLLRHPEDLFSELKRYREKLVPFFPEIKKHFEDYLIYGGFPRYVFAGKFQAIRYKQLLSEIYAKDINKKTYFDFMSLINIIAENEITEKENSLFEKSTRMDSKTITDILELSKSSYLLEFVEPYSKSVVVKGRVGKKKKKYYVSDRGLRNLIITSFLENDLDFLKLQPIELGKNAEATVRDILARILYHAGHEEPQLYYFAGERKIRGSTGQTKKYEVDFICTLRDTTLAVDVSYESSFNPREEFIPLGEFRLKVKNAKTILITKDTLENVNGHIAIPIYLFALIV